MKERKNMEKVLRKIIVGIVITSSLLLSGCSNAVEDGTALLEEGNITEAQEQFQKAVDKEKDLGEAYRGLGICYWEQEDYEQALEAFEQALEHGAEKTGPLYNMLGICAMKLEKPEKAVAYFGQGLELETVSTEVRKEMAFNEIAAYEKIGLYSEAKELLKGYVAEYPDDEKAAKELEFLNTQAPETE